MLLIILCGSFIMDTFKQQQQQYPRVRFAYAQKDSSVQLLLDEHSIAVAELNVYLRAFKAEKKIEVWGKNKADSSYVHITDYHICGSSGVIGPKRRQGDFQVPEGFYYIDRFNPASSFYLSLGLNYPNASDRVLGDTGNLGGDIFIHGSCATIGCLPITDSKIMELYILCVEAKNNGQEQIPVTIFPKELNQSNYEQLLAEYAGNDDFIGLWSDLKKANELFSETKQLPQVSFQSSGRHRVE